MPIWHWESMSFLLFLQCLKQGSKQNLYVEKLSMNVEVWDMFLEELIIDQSIIQVYLQSHTSFEGFDHRSRHQLSWYLGKLFNMLFISWMYVSVSSCETKFCCRNSSIIQLTILNSIFW